MNDLLANPFVQHLVLRSMIFPGVATLVTGLILLAFERAAHRQGIGSLWSIPLLVGLLVGYFGVYGDWSLWPHTVLGWLPVLAIATVLLTGSTAYLGRFGWLAAALLVGCASVAMLKPILSRMTAVSALVEWAWVAILWWLLWSGASGGRGDRRGAAASQVVLAAGLAAVGPLSQSILLGQLAMVLGASGAVVLILSWLRPGTSLTAPVVGLGTLVLGILVIELWFYASAPLKVVLSLLVAAALGVATQGLYYRLPTPRPLTGLVLPAAATALPVVVGVFFAWQAYSASGGGY